MYRPNSRRGIRSISGQRGWQCDRIHDFGSLVRDASSSVSIISTFGPNSAFGDMGRTSASFGLIGSALYGEWRSVNLCSAPSPAGASAVFLDSFNRVSTHIESSTNPDGG